MQQTRNGSNTGSKLANKGQFTKGHDPRRNLNGRPRSFDQVRELAQELAHAKQRGREAIINVLTRWRDSPEPMLQVKFVEYAFGKVPDKLDLNSDLKPVLILHYGHQRKNMNGAN